MKFPLVQKISVLLISVIFLNILIFPVQPARASDLETAGKTIVESCAKAAAAGLIASAVANAIIAIWQGFVTYTSTAAVPVGDKATQLMTKESAVFQKVIKGFQDCLIYGAGQYALNQLNKNTLDWIKKGIGRTGTLFATKPGNIFLDLQAHVAGDIAGQAIKADEFYPGFRSALSNEIKLSTRQDSRNKFTAAVASPFQPGQTQAFYKDFRKGGWDMFGRTLGENGNSFAVSIAASNELEARQKETADLQQQKLNWAGGYIDLPDPKKCDYPPDIKARAESKGLPGQPTPYSDAEQAAVLRLYCKITTPGKIIQSQSTATINSDIQRLGFVDTLSKLFASFMLNKIVSQTAKTGLF